MKDELSYISNNMKSYRARSGYSQEETADLLDVSRATYCDYEVNPTKVKIETFYKLADIFCCDLSDFFVEIKVTRSDTDECSTKKKEQSKNVR